MMDVKAKSCSFFKTSALLIISIATALLLAETALRIIGRKPLYVNPERPTFWKYDALLGWAHQSGQQGVFEKPQFRIHVRINQKGLRDREHSYKRRDNMKRILVLGDSFAWGFGVEETNRLSELLEKSLGVEVINAGVSGYSTDQELLWFRSEGIKYDTDLIILVFCSNDERDNHLQRVYHVYNKPRFTIEENNLTLKGVPVPKVSLHQRLAHFLRQHSAFFYLFERKLYASLHVDKNKAQTTKSSGSSINSSRKSLELTIALLNEMRYIAEINGAQFMLVASSNWESRETYGSFIDALRANGFWMIEDVESLQRGFDPTAMTIPDDGHWNNAGHEFVANTIKEYIENNQLLSTPRISPTRQ